MNHLIITVRFLDNRYHGLLTKIGPPEWPPSPYRLFQALVSGVARRGELVVGKDKPDNHNFKPIGQALGWLQRLSCAHPPIIIAPRSQAYEKGDGVVRFVPNNDDETYWHPELHRVDKPTIPTLFLLEPDQKPEVHYVWDISACDGPPVDRVRDAARSLTSLGWGIDMAFADAERADEARLQSLRGIRWYPKLGTSRDDGMLRTPTYDAETKECTLSDLRHCHHTAINRIEHGKPLKTADKPKVFDRVLYTSVERPISRPYAVFKLLNANEDTYRHPHAKLIHIAGMVRHVAIERMKDDSPSWKRDNPNWVDTFVCGHRGSAGQHQQISYVPLPSIGDKHGHADAIIRNVMLIAPHGCDRELEYVAQRLNGEELTPESEVRSIGVEQSRPNSQRLFLERINPPRGKFIAKCYLGTSNVWHSVTPVILDGHDDKKPEKTTKLIQTALQRAGIETPCEFTWQAFPYLKNCLSAHKYDRNGRHTGYHRPAHLKHLTAVHVRLTFTHPVPGPITIGAGRHCGFGLMAREQR